MRIAFHTPLNAFEDGRISGDRRMARQIATALEQLGHVVEPVRDARSYMKTPDLGLLERHRAQAAAKIEALAASWRAGAAPPDLWFTYHSYYKAPDLLGPAISEHLSIPYVVAEASGSERRAKGEWARHVALARASFGSADLHLCFTERDRIGVEFWCGERTQFLAFPPFIALDASAPQPEPQPGPPRLATVAMMRAGVKHESYLALARTLLQLAEKPWTLTVIGDGPLRAEVEQAFAALPPGRVTWLGALAHDQVAAELASHDIFIWPGLGEAYGLVYLEAQAAGLPVIAFASGGVPDTVRPDETAFLAPENDEAALALALSRLLADADMRARMGRAAATFVRSERTLETASAILAQGFARIASARPRAMP
ncbi:glycosyltransferase family 4 protein [Bosea psychrotolerans]|uniref:Glycosyltransferase involved in cell wall biosynthesis n=1 Tax=Bosea psychrotolerans TaxID=1871628 RepID=A0A2S4MAJ2_9HYPH|nr:glycosyltransferase [Bosea psychrotolerans]POR51756.1 glycosyltransferase involved in cell wall biosynthesis [Bosea psychrotolerans]